MESNRHHVHDPLDDCIDVLKYLLMTTTTLLALGTAILGVRLCVSKYKDEHGKPPV